MITPDHLWSVTSSLTASQRTRFATVTLNYLSSPKLPYWYVPENQLEYFLPWGIFSNPYRFNQFLLRFKILIWTLLRTTNGVMAVYSFLFPFLSSYSACIASQATVCWNVLWRNRSLIDIFLIHGNSTVLCISIFLLKINSVSWQWIHVALWQLVCCFQQMIPNIPRWTHPPHFICILSRWCPSAPHCRN